MTAEDVAPVADVDFKQPSQAVLTLSDGTVLTLTGTVAADKHWIQITSTKDAALTAKSQGRAFQIAGYRYDAIFRPLEQLLVAKEPPPAKPGAQIPSAPTKGAKAPQSSPAQKRPVSSPTP